MGAGLALRMRIPHRSRWSIASCSTSDLAIVMAGATALSRSCLILGADGDPSCLPGGYQAPGQRQQLRKLTLDYQPADAPQGPVGNRPGNPVFTQKWRTGGGAGHGQSIIDIPNRD